METLSLQRNGYLALLVVGGVAALALIALMVARVTDTKPADALALASIGFARRDLQLAVLIPGVVLSLIAAAGAVAVATLAQSSVPTGVAQQIGAGRDLADDIGFLALAGVVGMTAVVVVVLAVASRAGRADGPGLTSGRHLSGVLAWPAVGAGIRAAAGGLTSAGRRQAATAFAAVAIAGVGVSAVAVVVASRDGLTDDLSRAGKFYDVVAAFYPASEDLGPDRDVLLGSPSVNGVATVEFFSAQVDDVGIAATAVTAHKGSVNLRIEEGRLPVGDDELIASPAFLRRLDRSIGDTVDVAGEGAGHRFRIVGSGILPLLSPSGLPGEQIALTAAGRQLIGAPAEAYALGLRLADPSAVRAIAAAADSAEACDNATLLPLLGVDELAGSTDGPVELCAPKSDIRVTNIEELGALPLGVTGAFAVLAGAGLGYLLSASFRRSRREISVLRVLGFTRRQSATTVLMHAGVVGLVGSLLGLPFGVALGRMAWRGVADGAGVAFVPEVSLSGTAGLVLAAVVIALMLAVPFAIRCVSRPPAAWLRAE